MPGLVVFEKLGYSIGYLPYGCLSHGADKEWFQRSDVFPVWLPVTWRREAQTKVLVSILRRSERLFHLVICRIALLTG